jgi:integrase
MRCHGKKTINGINQDDIYEFLKRYEKHSSKTFNNLVGELRRFFQPAINKGYILKNPVVGIALRRLPQSLPRFLTDEEYMTIERLAEREPIFPMIVTARYTGLRLQELLHLEWQDFDWDRKLVRVLNKPKYGHTVKNFQIRVVPISSELKEKLLPYIKTEGICFPGPEGGPYNREGPRRALRRILDQSNLREGKRMLGYHSFRHTFASRLAQEGISIYKICKWLGHADIKTTQIYAHFAPVYDPEIEKLTIESQDPQAIHH